MQCQSVANCSLLYNSASTNSNLPSCVCDKKQNQMVRAAPCVDMLFVKISNLGKMGTNFKACMKIDKNIETVRAKEQSNERASKRERDGRRMIKENFYICGVFDTFFQEVLREQYKVCKEFAQLLDQLTEQVNCNLTVRLSSNLAVLRNNILEPVNNKFRQLVGIFQYSKKNLLLLILHICFTQFPVF